MSERSEKNQQWDPTLSAGHNNPLILEIIINNLRGLAKLAHVFSIFYSLKIGLILIDRSARA